MLILSVNRKTCEPVFGIPPKVKRAVSKCEIASAFVVSVEILSACKLAPVSFRPKTGYRRI